VPPQQDNTFVSVGPIQLLLNQCGVQNFDRVQGDAAGAVFNLVTATGAGRGDERCGGSRAHSREQHEFADLLRECEVLVFVTKRTGHAAAAGRNHRDFVAGGEFEDFDGRRE